MVLHRLWDYVGYVAMGRHMIVSDCVDPFKANSPVLYLLGGITNVSDLLVRSNRDDCCVVTCWDTGSSVFQTDLEKPISRGMVASRQLENRLLLSLEYVWSYGM